MYKSLIITLFKWIVFGGMIGIIVGSTTAFLLNTNDLLGEVRERNSWLILCLPLGGIVLGYLYMNLGIRAGTELYKGNNLVIGSSWQ
ncbi:H+/Cl- antiporter ClcA [Evansella vedderi]|uniref:H+/Cl- antiporter ClcA n=1 Tax=Evansella vedderi TaxID=38282 RepID=A0ABT9ZW78_9BACI|nr:hypothetical protein [Evansella vedderi]MDQ0254738.1 H+/Cl- antiporter ClcA [Evansella vedderi]